MASRDASDESSRASSSAFTAASTSRPVPVLNFAGLKISRRAKSPLAAACGIVALADGFGMETKEMRYFKCDGIGWAGRDNTQTRGYILCGVAQQIGGARPTNSTLKSPYLLKKTTVI